MSLAPGQRSLIPKGGAIFVCMRPEAKKSTYHARLKLPGAVGYIRRFLRPAT